MVVNLHRVPGMNAPVPTANRVLQMATEHGALTTGFGDRIGSLAPGKAADMVVVDWASIAMPYLAPNVAVVDAVLYRGHSAGVQAVLVGGEPIFRDGRFTRLDRDAVLAELARSLAGPPSAQEEQGAKLAAALVPRVRKFFDGWPISGHLPFYEVNSRT
jgi:cytosine/adenosine deaminase-related metal-dependent hydrolase